jgi:hypothetical protein
MFVIRLANTFFLITTNYFRELSRLSGQLFFMVLILKPAHHNQPP